MLVTSSCYSAQKTHFHHLNADLLKCVSSDMAQFRACHNPEDELELIGHAPLSFQAAGSSWEVKQVFEGWNMFVFQAESCRQKLVLLATPPAPRKQQRSFLFSLYGRPSCSTFPMHPQFTLTDAVSLVSAVCETSSSSFPLLLVIFLSDIIVAAGVMYTWP